MNKLILLKVPQEISRSNWMINSSLSKEKSLYLKKKIINFRIYKIFISNNEWSQLKEKQITWRTQRILSSKVLHTFNFRCRTLSLLYQMTRLFKALLKSLKISKNPLQKHKHYFHLCWKFKQVSEMIQKTKLTWNLILWLEISSANLNFSTQK